MARANTPAVKPAGTGVANWEERLALMAKESTQQEASVATGQFLNTRGGQLTWNGNPVKDNKLACIIVDNILENAYYEGDFDPDSPAPPVCYAFGRDDKEMAPHPDSPSPQHETCRGCPMNEFGTADRGKGKACKNIRRLAILPAEPLTDDAIQKGEIFFLKTPVTSVKGWAAYVRNLDALRHRPPLGVISEISAIPDAKTQFKLIFSHVKDIPGTVMGAIFKRHDEVKESIAFPYSPQSEAPAPARKLAARGAAPVKKPAGRKF